MDLSEIEFVQNPEPRCPVVLLLDTSYSMSGQPINALNVGVGAFSQEVQRDEKASLRVEVAIVTFGGAVQVVQDFVTVDQFFPRQLRTSGDTPMGQAIEVALDLVENRKRAYKSNGIQYYRPWVFLITDGAPTDGDRWKSAAQRLRQAEADRKLSFFTVGVQGADMIKLGQIAPPSTPPVMLEGLKFQALFSWLSDSMTRVSSSKVGDGMISLPPISGWAQTHL